MTVQISYQSLTSPASQLALDVLREPVLLRMGIEHDEFPRGLSNAVTILGFEGVKDDSAILCNAFGDKFELREAPLCPLAILINPLHRGREKRLLDWLRDRGVPVPPPVVEWHSGREVDTVALIVQKLAGLLVSDAKRIASSTRELSALRILNDNLQNRFATIESFLDRQGLQPFDLAFSNEPVSSSSRSNVLADASQDGISQILPVASAGVSAVAIHFERLGKRDESVLHAELVTMEDGRVVETWVVALSKCTAGWNHFGLSKSLAGLRRTLKLRLRVEGADDEMPLLSLGGLQPLDMFHVRDTAHNASLVKNSLALQVWCGMPGVVLPAWANYMPAQSRRTGEGGFAAVPVAPSILELATLANSDEISFEFPAILPLPQERAIACHPPSVGMTIGRLPAACPPQTLRISANAIINNEKSQDVEFALAVAGTLEGARQLLEEKRGPECGEAFSGWVRAAVGDEPRLNGFIGEQAGVWQNVYFATRMADPGDSSFAWAKFRDISLLLKE
ncbi:DUF6212 domain-containing protein [Microvirga antarctica]|uniref:DUF6212 domain-containing protein n=1 Tax=Microvirga antarctica TaxID=2819233 RepID=UPI001B304B67|nr:DUF6212 domain-containing protein [Microvirga antarctica]